MNNCCCKNHMSRESLLREIMALNFAINDFVLYLDTHPTDACAIKMHNDYYQKLEKLTKEYQEQYGPLTVNFDSTGNDWQWSEEPWPWERGMY